MSTDLNNVIFYILIVDDDNDDHVFLKRAIGKILPHAIVKSLFDGDEALEYLNKSTELPNLIFLDLNMQRLPGEATIKLIRKNPSLKKIPVVILTTSTNENEKKRMLELGANDFYSKPYHSADLVDIVREVKTRWLDPVLKISGR